MHFQILGPVEVTSAGGAVTPRAAKVRSLLAMLLASPDRVVSVDTLITELWGDVPPRTALQALRVYVSQLRRLVLPEHGEDHGPVLVTQPPGYRLDVGTATLDARCFTALCDEGRRAQEQGSLALACERYRAALALWRGPALADVRGGLLLESAALRLEDIRMGVLERRIDLDLALGRHDTVAAELRGLTAEHPYDEGLHARLMVALYRSGRAGEALRVYRCVRASLIEELGIEPGRPLQTVHSAILAADHDALHRAGPWAEPARAVPLRAAVLTARRAG